MARKEGFSGNTHKFDLTKFSLQLRSVQASVLVRPVRQKLRVVSQSNPQAHHQDLLALPTYYEEGWGRGLQK